MARPPGIPLMAASTRGAVPPFYVMDVMSAAKRRQVTHGDAIMLCVGQPSTPAPRLAREAAVDAVRHELLGYTESVGTPALRTAIADFYARRYDLDIDRGSVVVTAGSSGGFSTIALAAFEAGDRVAMTRPGYPAYRNTLAALGCSVVELTCGPESRYQPTVDMLEALDAPISGLVVASPANPTGTIIDPAALQQITRWCTENDVLLLSDEIYHGISFGRPCTSAWSFGRDSIVLGSVSKYHSMTGWRVGWNLVPDTLIRPMDLLQANLAICAPAVSQAAAVGALDPACEAELDGHVRRYARNQELLLRRLPELGISSFAPPDGAFYAYCDIGHLTDDSLTWCRQILDRTGVALAPGIDFDPIDGHRFMRLSLCGDTEQLDEAFDRLVAAV